MKVLHTSAAIFVLVILSGGCVVSGKIQPTVDPAATPDISRLWEEPIDLAAPEASTPFTFIRADQTGYSPGYDVRSRGGRRVGLVRERLHRHPAVQGSGRRQRDVEQLGLEDLQQQDLCDRRRAFSCRPGSRRLAWQDGVPAGAELAPMRGLGQGSRNDLEDFEEQGFIERVDGDRVEFVYRGIHGRLVDRLTRADVIWVAERMAGISDAQWDDAFRAAGYPEDQRRRYITKIKSKIAEGLQLAKPQA